MTQLSVIKIRIIEPKDAAGTRELYRYYVENTTVSFEYSLPSKAEWLDRIRTITYEYPWLVIELEDKILGYAYASRHRSRTAYNWSVETAVYIDRNYLGLGIGKALYLALFDILRLQGYRNVYAGITLPNERSVSLHKSMGFYEVGVFKKIGFKSGAWHDTGWFQLHLCDFNTNPGPIKSLAEVHSDPQYNVILERANKELNLMYLKRIDEN